MKIFRFWELIPSHNKYEIKFETQNRDDMYYYIIDRIWAGTLYYDPCCNHPSKSKMAEIFDQDFRDRKYSYIKHLNDSYIEEIELHPEISKKDRDTYLHFKLLEHYQEAVDLGYEVLGVFIQGSQNYNLDLYGEEYESDVDTKCIILPSLDDILYNKKPFSDVHERENKEHIDIKDIRVMFECFRKQNIQYVEVLFTDYFIINEKYKDLWDQIVNMNEDIVRAHPAQMVRTMSGMSGEKLKALKHPYPTIIDKINKYGYDPKQLHHIVRMNDFIKKYIDDNIKFKDSLVPKNYIKKKLLDIKVGKIPLDKAEKMAKEINEETKEIKDDYIDFIKNEDGTDKINQEILDKMEIIKVEIMKRYIESEIASIYDV